MDVNFLGPQTSDFERLDCLHLIFYRKCSSTLLFFDARFRKQRGCKTRNLSEVHIILEGMNTPHVQMAKTAVPKIKCDIFHWRLYQVGCFCFVHLYKIKFVQVMFAWCNCNGYTIAKFDNAFV